MEPRLRRVASVHELDAAVEGYLVRGYRIVKRNDLKALVQKVDKGTVAMHIVLFMLTVWWSFGLVNLIYMSTCQRKADQVLIQIT